MIDLAKEYVMSNRIEPIDVSNHHKAKMFEMCNNIMENNKEHANIFLMGKMIRVPKQGEKEFGYNDFHWFELCTTHLSFHIMNDPLEYLEYCIKYAMLIDKIGMQHPIDYLYEEYYKIRELFKEKYIYQK